MEIKNASTTPSKSYQLRNVNTVRWESTQPWGITCNNRLSEDIHRVCRNHWYECHCQ